MKKIDAGFYDNLRKKEWKNTADFGPSSQTRYSLLIQLLKKHDYNNPNSILLDCGCGSGNFLLKLSVYGYKNISGSDFSKQAVNLAKEKQPNIDIFNADLTKLKDFDKKRYDIIVCSDVLEHINDDVTAINNIYSLLNKNGLLLISVPCNNKYWSLHDDFSGHIRRYSNNDLDNKLKINGFDILESFGWGSLFYSLYHSLLVTQKPSKIMGNEKKAIKVFLSKILYYLFSLERLYRSKKRARRLFIVARKNEKKL